MSLTLLDWRRRVAQMYADVRHRAPADPPGALADFRAVRDRLFATHPESPIPAVERPAFAGLAYWPYDPALRFEPAVDTDVERFRIELPMSRDEAVGAERIGRIRLPCGALDVFWLALYGGGVFLPFRDATSGAATYGGGRYLLDTVKGADLGGDDGRLVVDFNYAYHPSCAYDPVWSCPLAPKGNRLEVPIEAGERNR
ncbi:MAG: DUF1684 domain-containing protein [Candidatus Rokubacteria bacterium]|nr:DUF1684 domain-containing protein [Candidatus Rokubacteria bacterium]